MLKILIAPDKFKNGASASELANSLAIATKEVSSNLTVATAPITDGGEGFVEILGSSLEGTFVKTEILDALFRPKTGSICEVPLSKISIDVLRLMDLQLLEGCEGHLAIVEMAQGSGIENLSEQERNPWKTSSIGTGQLLRFAASRGAKAILLGIGGSATNDCGMGALEALGVIAYDKDLQPVPELIPEKFNRIATIGSTSHLTDKFPPIRIACDVQNPLLGENGASAVFGPQKGLLAEDLPKMDRLMRKTASRLLGLFGTPINEWESAMQEPGSGAAGGIGFALSKALPDAKLVHGFPLVSALLQWQKRISEADIIITGEGRFDTSSLSGKGPVALLAFVTSQQKILFLAGSVEESASTSLQKKYPKVEFLEISQPDENLSISLKNTLPNATKIYKRWLTSSI